MTYRCPFCQAPVEIDPHPGCCGEVAAEIEPESLSYEAGINLFTKIKSDGVLYDDALKTLPFDAWEQSFDVMELLKVTRDDVYAADEPKDPQHWKEEL